MASAEPLYERDPEAYQAHLAEGNANQPRKRVVADVLIRDRHDRILLVDPNYKPDWDLPGGMVEANEPPHLAAQREIREELGIELPVARMLCVDWVSPHGVWDDSLAFIFDGGHLTDDQIGQLELVGTELERFEFVDDHEAARRLRDYLWRRVEGAWRALGTTKPAYLVDGHLQRKNPAT
jgi:8-oxo-dGTP pyrophosphatase MutT (NUDIX family)